MSREENRDGLEALFPGVGGCGESMFASVSRNRSEAAKAAVEFRLC